jgi:hypothetical protein
MYSIFTIHNGAIKVLIEGLRFTKSSIEKVQKKKVKIKRPYSCRDVHQKYHQETTKE